MKTLIALFAAAICTAAVADDQQTSARDKSMSREHTTTESAEAKFSALDRNQDQRLSKSEAEEQEGLSDQFASIDANSDGYLSKSEYKAKSMSDSRSSDPY